MVRLIVSLTGRKAVNGYTKSYAKVIDFARIYADNGITTLLLSHQTKNREREVKSGVFFIISPLLSVNGYKILDKS